ALVVRRQLPKLDAAVCDRDRIDIRAPLGREILERVEAAQLPQLSDDVLGHLALIETVAALLSDDFQRAGKRWKANYLADTRRPPIRQEMLPRSGVTLQLLGDVGPVEGHARRDWESAFGILDGRSKNAGQRLGAMIGKERRPPVDGAGHRHRVRRLHL